MPAAMSSVLRASRAAQPLAENEEKALDRALRSIRSELLAFLSALPVSAQNASGLSRHLGVERTTCQRVVSAITAPYPGLELAGQLPGTRGIRMLVEAAREKGIEIDPGLLERIDGALTSYDEMTKRLGGSRTKLLERLKRARRAASGSGQAGREDALLAHRAHLFESAAALTGRHSDLWLAAHIYSPHPERRDVIRQARAHGLVGHRASADAVPLTFHVFGDHDADASDQELGFRPLKEASEPGVPAELLPHFSTSPVPIVRSSHPEEFIVQAIETSPEMPEAEAVDLIFAMQGGVSHPRARETNVEEVWALVNFPVRRMLFDVFMHKDLARQCVPGLDVHLWRPDFAQHVGERWQTRFKDAPALHLLSSGLERAQTDAWNRYTELLRELFDTCGFDPSDYVGFRCDEPYPVWRTGYCMGFEFGDDG